MGGNIRWHGIRTSRYKLIHHDRVDEWELIDLQEDPLELTNVYDDEQYADVVEQLFALMVGFGVPDDDVDGHVDLQDNCAAITNPDQRDTDFDGYGNLCDGDFNNDGAVAAADLTAFKRAYQAMQGDPRYDAEIDLNGDGAVTAADFSRFHSMYLAPPGPSGHACAGNPPCPPP